MHLGEAQKAEVQGKLDALDQERVDLLRHQSDLPGVEQLIEHQLTEAKAALEHAAADLQQVRLEALAAVEAEWLEELLAALEPPRLLLDQAPWLDQAWEQLGVPPSPEHGHARLLDVALRRLRR